MGVLGHGADTGGVLWHLPRDTPYVAITFDDGPDDTVTPQLLTILREFNVKGTFFLVGHMVAKHPHMVAIIGEKGHQLANHSWAHYRLDEMGTHQITQQFKRTHEVMARVGGQVAPYVRPPGGRFNNHVVASADALGMRVAMWDVNAADYVRPNGFKPSADWIAKRVLGGVQPGSIILMHNSPMTVAALPMILGELQLQGYTVGPLP